MAAGHYYSFFVLAHLVHILREGIDRDACGFGGQQLRVITFGVHTQHYGIQVLCYFFGVPAILGRQQPLSGQVAFSRVIDLVIAAGYFVSLFLQCQR